jgi:biotin synthase-like enzyme
MAGASGTMTGNYLTTSGRDRKTDLQLLSDVEVKQLADAKPNYKAVIQK